MSDESKAWDVVKDVATGALNFWVAKLDVMSGANFDKHLKDDANGMKLLTCLLRAVSWVESKHTTDTSTKKNKPSIDPMQCGNPRRILWKTICGKFTKGDRIRFNNDKAVWLGQMDKFLKTDASFPDAARMSHLKAPKKGRNDEKFNLTTSYYWGTLLLIHKINKQNGATYKAGDITLEDLIEQTANNYNAEDHDTYVSMLKTALNLSGCQ